MIGLAKRLFSREQRHSPSPPPAMRSDLDMPLAFLSPADPFTLANACEGVQILGSSGSGKTSGSGQWLAKAYLRAGFGGLVLTAKPDERRLWERYAAQTGRTDSLIVFSPNSSWRFNFLDYELKRPGIGAGLTENLVRLFTTVLEASERGDGDGKGQKYWERALKQLLRNAVDLAVSARGALSLPMLHEIVASAPQTLEQVHVESWQQNSLCYRLIGEADARELPLSRRRDFELSARFWLSEFPGLPPETRGSILSTFTTMADGFLRGHLRDLFCSETNLTPEATHHGAIIIVDLPVKEYGELGVLAQVLFKYLWQLAAERRNTASNSRPIFLWVDEAHHFLVDYDSNFQTTARDSRACTVYLTQNLSNYFAVLGGEAGRDRAESLLGTLQTKIFHANGHTKSNEWAAELFAKTWQTRFNASTSRADNGDTQSAGGNESLDYLVEPAEFTTLRKGGTAFDCNVDAVVFQGGRIWKASGCTALRTTFRQDEP